MSPRVERGRNAKVRTCKVCFLTLDIDRFPAHGLSAHHWTCQSCWSPEAELQKKRHRAKMRFWTYVDVRRPDECWEWQRSRNRKGYGSFWNGEAVVKAHRYALEFSLGRLLSSSEFACHHCDNPACCNPQHLYAGDSFTNQQDAVKRNRWSSGNTKKTHCKRDHQFTAENTRINPRGERVCRRCDSILQVEYRTRKRSL